MTNAGPPLLSPCAIILLATIGGGRELLGQQHAVPLPLPTGATVVQTLAFPEGDRESFHRVLEASATGIRWSWEWVEVYAGDTTRGAFRYAELAADMAAASRLWAFHGDKDPEEHPGYTMHSLSRAVYRRLRAAGSDSLQVMALEAPAGGALLAGLGIGGLGRRQVPVRWRGTVSLGAPAPVSFPLLVNGRRVSVPALRLRGSFIARGNRYQPEIWVLADSSYPLVLKWVGAFDQPGNVLQTVRVDAPVDAPTEDAPGVARNAIERELAATCRVELPGIYFDFNSAALTPASDRTIASIAAILTRHPDWIATLEGHTDSIGSAAANQALSQRRVEAVRERLVSAHQLDPTRLRTTGYGSSRPRETNATLEGRARNRRVELVRDCETP